MKIQFTGFDPAELARRETLFHVANGYVGLRGNFEEGVPEGTRSIRGTYLNGFYDSTPIHYEEKLHGFASTQQSIVNVIDAQGIHLKLAGEDFSCFTGRLIAFEQVLDLAEGVYTRGLTWVSPAGRKTRLTFRRLASFVMPQLVLMQVQIEPLGWSGELRILSTQHGDVVQDFDPHDPRKASVGKRMLRVTHAGAENDGSLMAADTLHSGLSMASAVNHYFSRLESYGTRVAGDVAETRLIARIQDGEAYRLTKYCVYTDSRRFPDPVASARDLMEQAYKHDFAEWAQSQRMELSRFWLSADAGIKGDEGLNASLNWSMYTLLASAGRDGIGNIASKGLSGEGYEGHYFWDTEIYMFPFFLLTHPDIAKELLKSRAAMLPAARAHAREMGHETGALYAWRTITGSECSAYFPSGSAQYHINGAVAHAFLTYAQATGDLGFMAETGFLVLLETARLWMDAGHWQDGVFRIDSVTGPDEYSCIVNNNYYTNRVAQYHLRGTAQMYNMLYYADVPGFQQAAAGTSPEEMERFMEAADAMFLPYDTALGICAQDDAFLNKQRLDIAAIPKDHFPLLMHYHPLFLYRHQVCKQADTVLAHFLFEEEESVAVIRRTYDYYEALTTHDSSLSECVFSMMAARTGQTAKAYDYYRASAALDLENTHGNTMDGIHAANMGGCWMGIAFGFGGLRLHADGPAFRPCRAPHMAGYHFTITWRGSRLSVAVNGGEAVFTLLDGPGLDIRVYGERQELWNELRVPLKEMEG